MSTLILASAAMADQDIESVLAHPIFNKPFACMEHEEGQLQGLGDALGSDCIVHAFVEDRGRLWMRSHQRDGRRNEDWFGWHVEVLSPCTCTVAKVHDDPIVNRPGEMGKPPASYILLERTDRVRFVLAHVEAVKVKVGDEVVSGQALARVGNNGMSRHPHIHVGAWRDAQPLQIRFDLRAMGTLLNAPAPPASPGKPGRAGTSDKLQ